MTDKLYYSDPELLEFPATVTDVRSEGRSTAVILDRTAFYPEGGGQPPDLGSINDVPVIDVQKNEGTIVHVLDQSANPDPGGWVPAVGDQVTGTVDAERRRDYRQQHTGQHIISSALLSVGGHNTVSVHLGEEYSTIEVDSESVGQEDLDAVERLANEVIGRSLPVTSTWVTDSEIGDYPLRRPPKVSGSIRLVMVGDVDCVACGGVHAANTSDVRLVHCIGTETIRGRVRTIWKIGDRALEDYRMASAIVRELGSYLSVKPHEVGERVRAIDERLRNTEAELKRTREARYALVAQRLIGETETAGTRVITAAFVDEEKEFVRGVAISLSEFTSVTACLSNRIDEQLQWAIVGPDDGRLDFGAVRAEVLPHIAGKGGGKPPIWQGVGTVTSGIEEFFAAFRRITTGI